MTILIGLGCLLAGLWAGYTIGLRNGRQSAISVNESGTTLTIHGELPPMGPGTRVVIALPEEK